MRQRTAAEGRGDAAGVMTKGRAREVAVEIIRLAVIRYPPGRDPWLLPEDRIRDELAVTLASEGRRRVRLTYMERVEAATRIIQHGGTLGLVCKWLSLPVTVTEAEWSRESPLRIVQRLLESDPLSLRAWRLAAWMFSTRAGVKRYGYTTAWQW